MGDTSKNYPSTDVEIAMALGDVLEAYQIAAHWVDDTRPDREELEDAALVRLARAELEDDHETRMFLVAQAQVFATLATSRGE